MAKYCGYCGSKMPDNAKVCGNCGKPFCSYEKPYLKKNGKIGDVELQETYSFHGPAPTRCNERSHFTGVGIIALGLVVLIGAMLLCLFGFSKEDNAGMIQKKDDTVYLRKDKNLTSSQSSANQSLSDVAAGRDCSMIYPNMEELSVAEIIDGDTRIPVLFDKDGMVVYTSGKAGLRILSGFYNGMCLTNAGLMMNADGDQFRPAYLDETDDILCYVKDHGEVILWTVTKQDTFDKSKTVLTAWSQDGTVRFQCDSSQEPFSRLGSDGMYEALLENGVIVIGNAEYEIRRSGRFIFFNIDQGTSIFITEAGLFPLMSVAEGAAEGIYLSCSGGTMPYVSMVDPAGNRLPGWDAVVSKLGGTPVMSDGLVFFEGYVNEVGGKKFPAGFYDTSLNMRIDLSQNEVTTVYQGEPRFINGYAAVQLKNPGGVPFYGILTRDGKWTFEPQEGILRGIYPCGDGLIISVVPNEDSKDYSAYNEMGENLGEVWSHIYFPSYGYTASPYESFDGALYCSVIDTSSGRVSRVAKVEPDYQVVFLS